MNSILCQNRSVSTGRVQAQAGILRWVNDSLLTEAGCPLHKTVLQLSDKIFMIERSRGKKEAIRFSKEIRGHLFQFLSSNENLDCPRVCRTMMWLPKEIKALKVCGSGQVYPLARLFLTVTYTTRGFLLPPVLDTNTITAPRIEAETLVTEKGIKDFWRFLRVKPFSKHRRKLDWTKYHLSTKSGPNGQALASALTDVWSLPEELVKSIKGIGGLELSNNIDVLRDSPKEVKDYFPSKRFGSYRKVTAISDKEGKSRVVACLDYWSQTALRPLHNYLFKVLRRIPQDCTFNQGSFTEKLGFGKIGERFYSFDLTAATDRFPINLIEKVLTWILGKEYTDHWKDIMVGYPFETRTGNVSYAVGNPMGAYSSWNSFALTHHYVVFECCQELGIKWQDARYVLLGDDIVINDNALAELYKSKILGLGIGISLAKSHISDSSYEFAKRFVVNGRELTPFPIEILYINRNKPVLLMNSIIAESRKGWKSDLRPPQLTMNLLREWRFSRRYLAKLEPILEGVYELNRILCGDQPASVGIPKVIEAPQLIRMMGYLPEPDVIWNRIFFLSLNKCFTDSWQTFSSKNSLGTVSFEFSKFLTNVLEGKCTASMLKADPGTQIVEYFREDYMRQIQDYSNQTDLGSVEWKRISRCLTLPLTDITYSDKNKDIKIRLAGRLFRALTGITRNLSDPAEFEKLVLYESFMTGSSYPNDLWRLIATQNQTRLERGEIAPEDY